MKAPVVQIGVPQATLHPNSGRSDVGAAERWRMWVYAEADRPAALLRGLEAEANRVRSPGRLPAPECRVRLAWVFEKTQHGRPVATPLPSKHRRRADAMFIPSRVEVRDFGGQKTYIPQERAGGYLKGRGAGTYRSLVMRSLAPRSPRVIEFLIIRQAARRQERPHAADLRPLPRVIPFPVAQRRAHWNTGGQGSWWHGKVYLRIRSREH